MWLRRKYFKTGETQRLAPQRNGAWTVLEKLANGVNFDIQNDLTKKTQVIYHNRLYPAKIVDTPENTQQDDTENNEAEIVTQDVHVKVNDAFLDEDFSSSDESETDPGQNQMYPRRNRRRRSMEGSIPRDSINVVELKTL